VTIPDFRRGADGGRPIITPDGMFGHLASVTGSDPATLAVPPVLLVSWSRAFFKRLSVGVNASDWDRWWYGDRIPLRRGKRDGVEVAVLLAPIGSPGTVMIVEELIAAGARVVVGIGDAGGLQPSVPAGSCVIPDRALRDEGTSLHYVDEDVEARPDPEVAEKLAAGLAAAGIEPARGLIWTTDAPYRELSGTVTRLRGDGVVAVDMEAAALFVVAACRGVAAASVMVVADVLDDPWTPNFGHDGLAGARRSVSDAVAAIAPRLLA